MNNKGSTVKNALFAVLIVVIGVLYLVLLTLLVVKEVEAKTFSLQSVAYLCISIFVPLFFFLALARITKK